MFLDIIIKKNLKKFENKKEIKIVEKYSRGRNRDVMQYIFFYSNI